MLTIHDLRTRGKRLWRIALRLSVPQQGGYTTRDERIPSKAAKAWLRCCAHSTNLPEGLCVAASTYRGWVVLLSRRSSRIFTRTVSPNGSLPLALPISKVTTAERRGEPGARRTRCTSPSVTRGESAEAELFGKASMSLSACCSSCARSDCVSPRPPHQS
jgi:hypothetical protein